jgi:hypothetical protein
VMSNIGNNIDDEEVESSDEESSSPIWAQKHTLNLYNY